MRFNWNPFDAVESAVSKATDVYRDAIDIVKQISPLPDTFGNFLKGDWGKIDEGWKSDWSRIKHWLVPDMRRDRELMTSAATTPRRWIYGECRVSGQTAYIETSGGNNETCHLVLLISGRELTSIGSIYLDDKLITTFGTETVISPIKSSFGSNITVTKYVGDQVVADADLVAASLANQAQVTINITGSTVNGVARITSLTSVIGLFAGMTVTGTGIPGATTILYVGDTYIDLSANATADGTGVSFACTGTAERWTDTCILTGCAYLYFQFTYSDGLFPSGLPKITVVAKGHAVYDPDTTLTAWSDNPALCIYDYMTTSSLAGGMGCDASEIDTASVIAAAAICNQTVGKSKTDATLTEKRYTCNGTISLEGTPKSVLDSLLQSMLGTAVYSNGAWKIYAAAYTAPVATLDESWLSGDMSISIGASKSERYNTVKGTFVDPTDSWATKEFPLVTSATYLAEDGGEELVTEVAFNFTTSPTMAQRMAKIILAKSRLGDKVTYPCNFKAMKLEPHDTVYVNNGNSTNPGLGWSNRIFKIDSWKFNSVGGIELSLYQEDSAAYSWTPATDITEIVLPPATKLPDPSVVAVPSFDTLSQRTYDYNTGADTRVDYDVTWTAGQVGVLTYQLQFRIYDGETPGDWSASLETKDTFITVFGIAEGVYDFRLRAVNTFNVASAWVEQLGVTIESCDTTIPTITGLEIFQHPEGQPEQFVGKDVVLRWHMVNPRPDYVADYGPAGANKPGAWFRYYELEVYDAADTPGTVTPLRVEYLKVENYTYTHEKNHADNGASALRSLKFRIRAVATWGNGSWCTPITATNPAPESLTITTSSFYNGYAVAFSPSADIDGPIIYRIKEHTASFDPTSEGTVISEGPETVFIKRVSAAGTYYVAVAAIDSFGGNDDELNWSTVESITPSLIVSDDLLVDSVTEFTEVELDDIASTASTVDTWGTITLVIDEYSVNKPLSFTFYGQANTSSIYVRLYFRNVADDTDVKMVDVTFSKSGGASLYTGMVADSYTPTEEGSQKVIIAAWQTGGFALTDGTFSWLLAKR